jgi:Serine dehydrogenase proteinase
MINIFDNTIRETLNDRLNKLESYFDSDVVFYYGEINSSLDKLFRNFIEEIKKEISFDRKRLTIVLNTPGGSAETVEKMVSIIRFHYEEIYFIVPDFAMSAGTILCMSGDKIFMDYSSSLGPIDPQVYNGSIWVPALGYLDKVEELINKSLEGKLSEAEYLILQNIDLAELRRYEMAKDLTISLLKKWLVKYKFKNWNIHNSTKKEVTLQEKEERAESIATLLGDNKLWHSHGRSIDISTLKEVLKLQIDDYSDNDDLRKLIREYNDLICEYINRHNIKIFLHSRIYF